MINKRLLIKTLLAHNDENSFYDKKRRVDLSTKEGKAKFLKHICALSNSNPKNNSYIVVGVEDHTNKILGVDFFDDSKLQNLINAYLEPPPPVSYENVHFPNLPKGKVIGLVSIRPSAPNTTLKKTIWKYPAGTFFIREGSISLPKKQPQKPTTNNQNAVQHIHVHAQNNITLTLDGVMEFMANHPQPLNAAYVVFKETFVVCWAGQEKKSKNKTYYSRVDIELINEQVKLFYSTLDEVEISWSQDAFSIMEYVQLGVEEQLRFYPFEKVTIRFEENGSYVLDTEFLFEPPKIDSVVLLHLLNGVALLLRKIEKKQALNLQEQEAQYQIASLLVLGHLNGLALAKNLWKKAKPLLRAQGGDFYETLKEGARILRKVKYNS